MRFLKIRGHREKPVLAFTGHSMVAALLILASVANNHPARSEERIDTIAYSGEWIASAHHVSLITPPDMCVAFNVRSNIGIRAYGGIVDIKIANEKWSLPASVDGAITVSIGEWNSAFAISQNDSTSVSIEIPQNVYPSMFEAMDKAKIMNIYFGNSRPFAVSLVGSTRATRAFQTCAGIKIRESYKNAEENPFQKN